MSTKKKDINYREEFTFPDIPFQSFPVYAVSSNGKELVNFKSMVNPAGGSAYKYSRKKQLRNRSLQAKEFDTLINIGYFDGLGEVVREMPVIIENSKRLLGMKGLYILMDYYFPSIRVAVELDSEYHDKKVKEDALRDEYLKKVHGITTYRIRNFQDPRVQRSEFTKFREFLKTTTPQEPKPLIFTTDLYDYLKKGKEKGS